MSTFYIPPADKRSIALGATRESIKVALLPFIKGRAGRQKDENLEKATLAVMDVITPVLRLPGTPDKGATVMTEGASTRNPSTKEFVKKPENL